MVMGVNDDIGYNILVLIAGIWIGIIGYYMVDGFQKPQQPQWQESWECVEWTDALYNDEYVKCKFMNNSHPVIEKNGKPLNVGWLCREKARTQDLGDWVSKNDSGEVVYFPYATSDTLKCTKQQKVRERVQNG